MSQNMLFPLTWKGRATRQTFTLTVLLTWVVWGVLFALSWVPLFMPFVVWLGIIGALLFWPLICVSVQRLHDIGYPGVAVLAFLIPGAVFFLIPILMMWPGREGENRFGPDPKWQATINGRTVGGRYS